MEDKTPYLVVSVTHWSRMWPNMKHENLVFYQRYSKFDVGYMSYIVEYLKGRSVPIVIKNSKSL